MIESVKINGYRLLDHFCADFGQLAIVIGANATGKSTLMSCLQFISRAAQFSLKEVLKWEMGFASVLTASKKNDELAWELVFKKPRKHPYWRNVPLSDKYGYVYEVTIEKDQYDQAIPVYELLRTERPLEGHKSPLKLLEATRHKSHIFSRLERRLVPFDEIVEDSEDSSLSPDIPPPKKENNLDAPEEVSEQEQSLKLSQIRFYNEYPILAWARSLLSSIVSYPGFDVGSYSKLRMQPSEIRPLTALYPNGENLGTVLHEILTRAAYKSTSDEIREFLQTAYPFFDDIFAETAYGASAKVLVRVREKGMDRSMELWDLSDGILRFLCLAAALLNPVPPAFIMVDEPEVGLHPRLLPVVADMIKTASERTQVLITTHSPDLLNCFGIDDIAVMAREGNKITWERPGNRKSLRKMLENVVADSLGDLHRSGELEALG